jgi:hypothetical protein
VKEPVAKPLFEGSDGARHNRRRHAKDIGGTREAFRLHDCAEHFEACQIVHVSVLEDAARDTRGRLLATERATPGFSRKPAFFADQHEARVEKTRSTR